MLSTEHRAIAEATIPLLESGREALAALPGCRSFVPQVRWPPR
jgi:hypothetical protein